MSAADTDIDILMRVSDAPDDAVIRESACTPREALNWIARERIARDMIACAIMPTYYSAALILADMILDGHGDRPGSYVEIWSAHPDAEGAHPLMSGWAPADPEFYSVMNGYSRAAASGGFMGGSRDRLIEAYARRFKADASAYEDIREALTDLGLMPVAIEEVA